jgi:hypothetical protein
MPESTDPERGRRTLTQRDCEAVAGERRDAARANDRPDDR